MKCVQVKYTQYLWVRAFIYGSYSQKLGILNMHVTFISVLLKYKDKVLPVLIMKLYGGLTVDSFLTAALHEGESSLCGPHAVTLRSEPSTLTE
jgi:hypothetical protein